VAIAELGIGIEADTPGIGIGLMQMPIVKDSRVRGKNGFLDVQ
jgi:hypothetical protein